MTDPYVPILDALRRSRRVLITTHVRPDGDALGSSAAMCMGLRRAGIEAHVLLLSRLPAKLAFVFEDNQIPFTDVEAGWPENLALDRFDCLLVVDTGTWSQLPGLRERVAGWEVPKLVVDHHLTQEDWATHKLVDTTAAAAGELIAQLLGRWPLPLDAPTATALFLALCSDTGWFQYSNTTPRTMRLAADLMEAGVDTDSLYQRLYQNERPQRLAVQARAMANLQLLAGGRVAVMSVGRGDVEGAGADSSDTEGLINVPLQVRTVEVSALLVETGGPVRVSLRSKGQVDVAAFAQQFGGGGHARAAGLKCEGALDAVRDLIVSRLLVALEGSSRT